MRTIVIPANIILTFPAQHKVTDEIAEIAAFACEQHLNTIGMINYTGPMLQVGTLSFGLRAHFGRPVSSGNLKPGKLVDMIDKARPEEPDEPENG